MNRWEKILRHRWGRWERTRIRPFFRSDVEDIPYDHPVYALISISRELRDSGISQKRRYIRFTCIIPRADRLIRTSFNYRLACHRRLRSTLRAADFEISIRQIREKKKEKRDSPYTRRDSSVDARHHGTERWTACWQLSPTKQLIADQFSKHTTQLSLPRHPLQRSRNLRILVSPCTLDRIIDRAIFNVRPEVHGSSPELNLSLISFDSFLFLFFFFVSRRRRGVEKRNREERTTRAARSMAKADGTRMELVSFGSRTERIGLSIRNALARCPDQGAPRPRFSFLRLFLPRLFAQDRPSSWDKKNTIETRWNF